MVNFFIDRPSFGWVVAIVLVLGGLISVRSLPLEQYPIIPSFTISISASYGRASAKTIEQSVTQVIEQNLTGLNHLMYMDSASSDGHSARHRPPTSAEQVAVY